MAVGSYPLLVHEFPPEIVSTKHALRRCDAWAAQERAENEIRVARGKPAGSYAAYGFVAMKVLLAGMQSWFNLFAGHVAQGVSRCGSEGFRKHC